MTVHKLKRRMVLITGNIRDGHVMRNRWICTEHLTSYERRKRRRMKNKIKNMGITTIELEPIKQPTILQRTFKRLKQALEHSYFTADRNPHGLLLVNLKTEYELLEEKGLIVHKAFSKASGALLVHTEYSIKSVGTAQNEATKVQLDTKQIYPDDKQKR